MVLRSSSRTTREVNRAIASLRSSPGSKTREGSSASSRARIRRSELFEKLSEPQREGVSAAVSQDGFALFFAQRTGKTWVTCGVIDQLEPEEVMIVGPKTNLESTWLATLNNLLPHYSVFLSLDDYLVFRSEWKKAWGDTPCYSILLLNYEALPGIIKRAKKRRWNLIVYDEAQRLKQRTSRNSRLAGQLVKCSDRRIALSGTPLDKSPVDLWAIFRFVVPHVLGATWKAFEEEYIEDQTAGIREKLKRAKGQVIRQKLLLQMRIIKNKPKFKEHKWDQFIEAIKPYTMSLTKEDAGIEPAKITHVPVLMLGRQRRAYDQLEGTMVVDVGKLTITTALKIVRNGKLQQITGGFIKDEEGRVRVIGDAKARKLHVLLKRLKPPVAIFARYTHEVELIVEACNDYSNRVGVIWGKVKDTKTKKRRTEVIQAFQSGKLDYVVCQQRTGGVGVDLFRARKGIVYSMSHSWIDFDQMMSRLDYLKQTERAEFFLLYCMESVDEDIIVALDEKRSVSEITLERLKRRRS